MKRILISLLALLLITALPAQTLDYPTETVRGKEYYLYPVQKGEGLYRISKNFGVSQEDIIKANPSLETEGLKLGQTIRIPVVKKADTSKYIQHEIQPKETLYGLSKRYGVTQDAIKALNPEVSRRMPIGATLLIPRQTEETARLQKETPTLKDRHTPQVETPYMASPNPPHSRDAIHGVSQQNPTKPIIDLSLLFGEKPDSATVDSILLDSLRSTPPSGGWGAKPLRIAFLLPLMTNQAKRTAAVDRFLEFYEGALIALYEAQREEQRFEVFVYDIEKNDIRIQTILQQPEMQTMDAIIGPAYPAQIAHVSKFAYTHQIPTLIPFTNSVPDIDINPYLWQFNPSVESEMDTLIAYTQRTYPDAHYVFIHTNTNKPSASTAILHQHLQDQKASLQTINASAVLNDSLAHALKTNKENILVFDNEKYNQVAPLLEKVRAAKDTYSLTLFSHYGWQDELLPVRSFYASVFNKSKRIDLPLTMYSLKYKHFFGHELQNTQPRYDLLGYDLTTYFIQMLAAQECHALLAVRPEVEDTSRTSSRDSIYGVSPTPNDSVVDTISSNSEAVLCPVSFVQKQHSGLQSDIHFKQVDERGGFENTGIQIITK